MSKILTIHTGVLGVNTYAVINEDRTIVIDPGGDATRIIREIGKAKIEAVLLTHSHYDHLGAVNELLAAYPSAIYACHEICAKHASSARDNFSAEICGEKYEVNAPATPLTDRQKLKFAGIEIVAIFTPGHSDDSLCYYLPKEKFLFSGDTVFAGSVGRSDLPGGNGNLLIKKIKEMLRDLPMDAVIFPGHGESTTVAEEQAENPFLR